MTQPTEKTVNAYALLKQGERAIDVWTEASRKEISGNLTVRNIIAKDIGFINLATTRPQDSIQERIIKITTELPIHEAIRRLNTVYGVERAAPRFSELIA